MKPVNPLPRATRAALCAAATLTLACGTTPAAPVIPRLSVTRILAFGDSLTEGDATPDAYLPFFAEPTSDPGPSKSYPYKLLTLLSQRYPGQGIQVYNGGFGGRLVSADATGAPPRDLVEFLDAFHPDVMILMHGANDLNQADPDVHTIAEFVGMLVDQAQARGTRTLVSSLPPRVPGGRPARASHPELVVPFNAALAAMATGRGVPYLDAYSPIIPSLTGPDMAPDGLHLSQAGNDKLAGVYFTALRYLYETNR